MCSTKLSHVGESHVQSASHTFYSDGMLNLKPGYKQASGVYTPRYTDCWFTKKKKKNAYDFFLPPVHYLYSLHIVLYVVKLLPMFLFVIN